MPRYYRRRYRTIVRAPKKKWGSNLVNIENMDISNNTAQSVDGYAASVLAQNKTESSAPTPVIIKTGNFKLQADLMFTNAATTLPFLTIKCFIIFVPQGMEPTTYSAATALIQGHPEWILSWKVLEAGWTSSGNQDLNRFTMSSRLKRNLNSGDSILCILTAEGVPANGYIGLKGMCQFWTCAN